ncbi:MAG: hypothetical protein M0P71_16490 [Melioribacteraceae bacterium]|nr:hypothetical protein [Melioribacteraceae bacterium]
MNKKLEHKKVFGGYPKFKKELNELVVSLEQKHYLERKVKFLLEIRGYLKTNKLFGNYIEFGSYRSEMQYAAFKILSQSTGIEHFVGLDTYIGEPTKNRMDNKLNLFDAEGDFGCQFDKVKEFVDKNMNGKGVVIQGDFRDKSVLKKLDKYKQIAVSVIDCNLLSSIESAFNYTIKNIVDGGIIYFDDFFYNIKISNELNKLMKKANVNFIEHSFYPPFGKSYLVIRK